MLKSNRGPKHYGSVAEFDSPEGLLAAAQKTRAEGYTRIDAYSPFPVHGVAEAIDFHEVRVPWTVFVGGLIGGCSGIALQTYVSVFDYPLNSGGKPLFSLPAFVPVTFECTILFASFGAFIGMLAMNGLPKPYHPIFNTPDFNRATQDRFFLCVESRDPLYDAGKVQAFLGTLGAEKVSGVDAEELVYG